MHIGHDIVAVNQDVRVAWCAQRNVEYGAIFSGIDLLARVHRVDARATQGLVGNTVLGVVEIEAHGLGRQLVAAAWVGSEELAQMYVLDLLEVVCKRSPAGQPCQLRWAHATRRSGHANQVPREAYASATLTACLG